MDEDIKIRKNNIWIILLYVIGIVTLLLIIGFVIFRMALNTKKENNETLQKLSTSRRTTTSSLTEPTTEITTEETTISTTTTTTSSTTTTTTTTTSKKTKTTTTVVEDDDEYEEEDEEEVPQKTPTIVIPDVVRTPTNGESTNPNALNNWEWQVVEYINNNRTAKGLNRLIVASELRDVAETSIDKSTTIKELTSNLSDYSNYHTITATISTATELYNNMIKDKYGLNLVTDPYITYVGVGVIKKLGPDGIPAYYGVVIFE